MKTTKVKAVQGSGSFESQYGTELPNGKKLMYTYDYEFEDGVFMQANHKTIPPPFKVGDTVEYEVTRESEQYGKSGKVSKPDMSVYAKSTMPTDDTTQRITVGHAITNAVQIAISVGFNNMNDLYGDIKYHAKMILKIGEELNVEISKEVKATSQPPTEVLKANPQPSYTPAFEPPPAEQLPPSDDYRDTANLAEEEPPF